MKISAMLHYEHLDYMSIYEKDLFLQFDKGVLVSSLEVDNTKTFDPEDPFDPEKSLRAYTKRILRILRKVSYLILKKNDLEIKVKRPNTNPLFPLHTRLQISLLI